MEESSEKETRSHQRSRQEIGKQGQGRPSKLRCEKERNAAGMDKFIIKGDTKKVDDESEEGNLREGDEESDAACRQAATGGKGHEGAKKQRREESEGEEAEGDEHFDEKAGREQSESGIEEFIDGGTMVFSRGDEKRPKDVGRTIQRRGEGIHMRNEEKSCDSCAKKFDKMEKMLWKTLEKVKENNSKRIGVVEGKLSEVMQELERSNIERKRLKAKLEEEGKQREILEMRLCNRINREMETEGNGRRSNAATQGRIKDIGEERNTA
ncbi:zinc finger protein on ecdysone puffs-like [Phymastichus coffea]|uniref:zinc finger protein on ecdysone puffs-like n=1 Tax=Phymastichus coffea TaxID=108790 RepID=UPI00273AC195|nr:zinc finger protein on ecdysone puffs-like [Phymastichus coffea]